MLLIVDTNVLITFFWDDSCFKRPSLKPNLFLYSPELSLSEINKYSSEIVEKTGLSQEEFKKLRRELPMPVEFIPLNEYEKHLEEVKSLSRGLPENEKTELLNDADFFALALKFKSPIWSNDRLFKKQSRIKIFSTVELINLLE